MVRMSVSLSMLMPTVIGAVTLLLFPCTSLAATCSQPFSPYTDMLAEAADAPAAQGWNRGADILTLSSSRAGSPKLPTGFQKSGCPAFTGRADA